ncbi:hypothetical protein L3Q82_004544 [Scortum barcoo]|uniref:Uncharacterized protein n=1 Tax=Scortum barcoo TaxID=214431 RepID=A0ACB8VIX7_9TELE|nr:hypothetical protein L3Q82_004544 [Scortum barcoo]
MKCFERLVKSFITSSIPDSLDPLQFAYRPNRSTEDAIALTLHTALSHLDQRDTYVRMLFIDYSSAFNTIVPSKLVTKLRDLGLNSALCDWILNFLTGRPQAVRMGSTTSSTLTLNTGAPQGCVLSPLLYSLFTHDCVAGQQPSSQHQENQGADHGLQEEAERGTRPPLHQRDYGGESQQLQAAEAQHGLQDTLQLLQVHHRESILTGCITTWYSSCNCKALQRVVKAAQHITRTELPSMEDLYTQRCRRKKATKITKDPSHPATNCSACCRLADAKTRK